MQNEQQHAGAKHDASGHLEPLARPEALTEMVADRLRSAILSGALAPGTHLSVPEIAKRLGVSRTPAREGLIALEREGLVEPRASAGVAVIAGGTGDILDLLDIREGLEIITVRRAAERMDADGIAKLKALFAQHEAVVAQNDLAGHVELDSAFHGLIREGAADVCETSVWCRRCLVMWWKLWTWLRSRLHVRASSGTRSRSSNGS